MMNRSPLFYPLNRAGDADGGGAADLQTDIMRFMAILSLCLVAIFALVQSIPLAPPEPVAPATPDAATYESHKESMLAPAMETPVPTATASRTEERPTLAPADLQAAPPASVETSDPDLESDLQNIQIPDEVPPTRMLTSQTGFTLRFSSDLALTRLVARNEVALYAINPNRALRLSFKGGEFSFRPAATPNTFHEMDAATVPAEVIAALRRTSSRDGDTDMKWGVTLPANMRERLDRYVAENTGGALVIEPDGNLRLEQSSE